MAFEAWDDVRHEDEVQGSLGEAVMAFIWKGRPGKGDRAWIEMRRIGNK